MSKIIITSFIRDGHIFDLCKDSQLEVRRYTSREKLPAKNNPDELIGHEFYGENWAIRNGYIPIEIEIGGKKYRVKEYHPTGKEDWPVLIREGMIRGGRSDFFKKMKM